MHLTLKRFEAPENGGGLVGWGWGCGDILLEMETGEVWLVEQSFLHFVLGFPVGLEWEKVA